VKKVIKTIAELKEVAKVEKLSEVDNKKLAEILKNYNISSNLLYTPEILHSFNEIIKSMSSIGQSIEETKRKRWEVLKELALADKLSNEDVLEAMKLL
jgi:arsenate reductase-like glutaredoxin family protein